MSDEKDIVDPSPTTPVEYLEVQKRRSETLTADLFREQSILIHEALKGGGGREFKFGDPGHNSAAKPAVVRAAEMLKNHFENAGWEVDVDSSNYAYSCNLYFDLPGTRAKERKTLKIVGIVAALIILGGLGSIFGYPVVKEKFFTKATAAESADSKLAALIKEGDFTFVESDITAANFPDIGAKTDFKVYDFDGGILFEEVVEKIEKDGYQPANLRELIAYSRNGWNGKDVVVAVGQTWQDARDNRCAPYVSRCFDGRGFFHCYYNPGCSWNARSHFLAVRK